MLKDKRILYLGNNTEDTDRRTTELSVSAGKTNHGLISKFDGVDVDTFSPTVGFYHTSYVDLDYSDLIKLADKFDEIIVLGQPVESYQTTHEFHQTVSIAKHIAKTKTVIFQNNRFENTLEDIVKENKSICILPFIQSVQIDGNNMPCCRAGDTLSKFDPSIPYDQDAGRNQFKEKMLKGEKLDKHCDVCYKLEDKNVISPRIALTVEWANRLNIYSLEELNSIKEPVSYEVRASNECNIMCRSCNPLNSNLIAEENKKTKVYSVIPFEYTGYQHINIDNIEKLYVAGGEPTISEDLYLFLEECLSKGKTDLEIQLNTNAVNLSTRFKSIIKHFSNITFEISIDGYKEVNQYVRWPTKWNKLIDNIDYLYENNHRISFNTVVSIYTITSLYDLINFLSLRYKDLPHHLTQAGFKDDILSSYNCPTIDTVVSMLLKIKQLDTYKNNVTINSQIDSYYTHYTSSPEINLEKLKKFFEYSDKLDQSRNVKLKDYIPELEACRSLITKQTQTINAE